jgi:hypothetical protein
MMPRTCDTHPWLTYLVRIDEYLDDDVCAWFGPLTVGHPTDNETTLVIHVRDQAELHGLLIKIRDFNLTLIELVRAES